MPRSRREQAYQSIDPILLACNRCCDNPGYIVLFVSSVSACTDKVSELVDSHPILASC